MARPTYSTDSGKVRPIQLVDFYNPATANTVTGGYALNGGYMTNDSVGMNLEKNLYYLGSTISGTADTIVLCARPLAANADVFGSISIREIS